jgi:spore germination cell wall hydrolase CwlJ-like protein
MWHKHESFADCMLAACAVICGRHDDPTSGSLHYFDPRAANPSWAKGMTSVCTIGHHQFYNNIR